MKKRTKLTAVILSVVMTAGMLLTGCGSTEEASNEEEVVASSTTTQKSEASAETPTTAEPVTIKILHKGPKPEGWDAVYEEYLNRTKDTLNIELEINWVEHADYKEKLNLEMNSGGDWDLVFDAGWIQLKNMAAEGYYADLSEYFNNPEYPGLQKSFSADTMEANTWYGRMCYIPLFETYGNGIPCIWYRADWAREWGIGTDGQINTYEEMEQYWQAAKDNGIVPFATTQARGFFQIGSLRGESINQSHLNGIQCFSSGGLTFWVYSKDGKLIDIAVEGSGDEAFANFPEGYNYDFGLERFEKFAEWQAAGYMDPDSLSCTDADTPFDSSLCASIVGTLDDFNKREVSVEKWGTDMDALGFFIYEEHVQNMEDGAISTDRSGNNGWAVPESSTKKDATMKFLDWMFSSQENHDLIQLGLEGVDFEYGETEGTYKTLTSYSADLGGYGFSWNPQYALIDAGYTGDVLEYREYELSEEAFASYEILGFRFDTSDVDLSNAVAKCTAVTDMTSIVKLHGIKTNGNGETYDTITEMINANVEEAMANGGQEIYDALKAQLEAYLAQ